MLKLTKLTQSLPGSDSPILSDVDLELQRGDFCIVLGSNGSGKSTLIRAILGETKIDGGSVYIDGEDFTEKNRSRIIAAVTQNVYQGTVAELSLLENFILTRLRNRHSRLRSYRQHRQTIIALIKRVDEKFLAYIDQPLLRLSGGQRQMLATIMAIYSSPQLLLLDEHTSALDPKMQNNVMQFTASAIEQFGITALMVTHRLEEALQYGNRLIMLDQGRIIFSAAGHAKSSLTLECLQSLFRENRLEVQHDI